MTDLSTEAVEAAAWMLYESAWAPLDTTATWDEVPEEARGAWLHDARAVLTAAAPHIATQATAQVERDYMTRSRTAGEYLQETNRLRAGIEALRDEWRMHEAANLRAANTQPENSSGLLLHTAIAGLCKAHADALDALLRGAK